MHRLRAGLLSLEVAPGLGGSVVAWRRNNREILCTSSEGTPVLERSCFPLAPYVGRVVDGSFDWLGQRYQLPNNVASFAQPIHGNALIEPWRVLNETRNEIVLGLRYHGRHWPWQFDTRLHYRLEPHALTVTMALTNLDETPMPAAIGLHPYFAGRKTATLTTDVEAVWLHDAVMRPHRREAVPDIWQWSAPKQLADLQVDNGFTGWQRQAFLRWEDGLNINMSASECFTHLIVYTPETGNRFCVEPVSSMPAALSCAEADERGVASLSPGDCLAGTVTFEVG